MIALLASHWLYGVAFSLLLGPLLVVVWPAKEEKERVVGRMVTFRAMKNHRDYLAGKLSADDYSKADATPIVEPIKAPKGRR